MILVRQQCTCGRVSEDLAPDAEPPGWFKLTIYWVGRFRSCYACSSDCIESVREFFVRDMQSWTDSAIERVRSGLFERVP